MKIHRAGNTGIALLLARRELEDQGVSWEQFDGTHARQWVSDALYMMGSPYCEPLTIEAFRHDDGILVFARFPLPMTYILFDDFETLLAAVHIVGDGAVGDLYAFDRRYVLALTGAAAPQWREFGRVWHNCKPAVLAEYGKLLLRDDAVAQLARHFACV